MAKTERTKFITQDILKSSVIGSFQKLDPRYMVKNPVMFVVEIGFFITLILTVFPTLFGGNENYRIYNGIVTAVLFVTVLFANFAESVAEGRGKAQAASLKKTKKDTKARILLADGEEKMINASELKKGDVVLVKMGEVIPERRRSHRGDRFGGRICDHRRVRAGHKRIRRRFFFRNRRDNGRIRLAEDPDRGGAGKIIPG